MKKNVGQTLSEYAMIGTLVLVVAIGGLSLLGDKLSGMFGEMIPYKGKSTQAQASGTGLAAESPAAEMPDAEAPPTETPIASEPPPVMSGTGNVSITLADGTNIRLDMPTDIAESVQTVGANGTVDRLALSLKMMADQMVASGEITEQQGNTILNLANQAHHMADIQKTLETITTSYGTDVNALKNTPVTIDGKTYANAYEASMIISTNGSGYGSELDQFWKLYTTAAGATHQWPPELQKILAYHAATINDLTDLTRVALSDVIVYNSGPPEAFQNFVISNATNKKAASICEMGNNQDNGVKCE